MTPSYPLNSAVKLTVIALPLTLLQLTFLTVNSSDHQHLFTDSFPRNDEYNMMALEPETPFGTPYGGFSRATASRLAALPLKLPSISKEVQGGIDGTAFEPMYMTVRDNIGRQYACRVYHEDELDSSSLSDSMFDTPRLKKKSKNNDPSSSSEKETKRENEGMEEHVPVDASKDDELLTKSDLLESRETDAAEPASDTSSSSLKLSEMGFDPIMLGHLIHRRLTKLSGLCAQLHPSSWWSYEWCHQEAIKQFHVKVTKNSNGMIKKFEIEHVTNLGSFSGRRIEVATNDDDEVDSDKGHSKDLTLGRKEIGRVIDTFVGGDACPETGKPRVTEATFRCCSKRHIARNKGGVLKNGDQVDTDIISVFEATEDENLVCHYNITLCTPLLCDDYDDGDGTGNDASKSKEEKSSAFSALDAVFGKRNADRKKINLELDPEEAEKMSVVEILERTFGKPGDFCMRSQTAGWWAYEFCPGEYVRQYHEEEVNLIERITGVSVSQEDTTSDVTEHILGRFIPEDHEGVTKENEWEHVVNATSSAGPNSKSHLKSFNQNHKKNHKSQSGPSTSAGGNGAYYFQEYSKGDICDHEDVTDSAIKAGEFGEGGIERAITVRYSCKDVLSISVKEDSTCHYIVDITVPTLCHHPLFKAPISKRQIVKCLPYSA